MASEDDNYGSLLVKGTPVAELKVNDIKKELDKRGLSKAGSKTQMLERLKAQLLLEKLQQDAAQSSGDELEGNPFWFLWIECLVVFLQLQQESAGQSEFVRQYLEQQQKNLERQMEVKKQVEEERKRKSADESSADETATPQDSSKPTIDPEVTSPKKFKDDNSNAPATEESKMPRPARKSSRNVSKGKRTVRENGQDSGVVKEKSRSPSPEKESLRERTRSGSSSSSRSATPDAASIRGRSTRGARGGRRGGKRGRGRQQVRKESRSSSHSSTEEEIMPKKRNRRSTNSRSSRSRSRSPPQKTSPELTPATRRSSRRISTAKTPPETEVAIDLTPAEPIQKTKESVFKNEDKDSIEKPGDEESKSSDVTDTKTANVKEVRRSVEVLEPAAGTIKTIEIADMTNESGNGKTSQDAPSNGEAENGNENSEEKGGVSSLVRSKENAEPPSEPEKFMEPESKHKEIAKVGKERAKSDPQQSDKAQGPHDSTATTDRIPKDRVAVHESSKQSKEDEIKEVSKRRRSGSSSSSSNSPSPQRKKEIKRGRSDSSGSSTDVSPSAHAGLSKSPASKYTPEVSKEKPTDSEKESQPTISEVSLQALLVSDNIKNNDSEETAVDKQDQPSKNVDDEATMKKDKTAKKRKWGSKSSKTLPAAAKKPTSMEISSDSLKNLIGEVKLSETVFDMETEVVNTLDYDEQEEDRRDVKVKRTVVKNSPPEQDAAETAEARDEEDARKVEASGDAPEQNDKEQEPQKMEDEEQSGDENKEQPVEPKKKIIATTRPSKPILPVVDEPEKVPGRGEMSPARHPPDRVIRIAGLVRPFTLGQLKELLKRTGELDEEHFWINDIKSHCLAAFKSEQDAVKTRAALHGTRWPQSNPKILIVDFATIEDVSLHHLKNMMTGENSIIIILEIPNLFKPSY
ncbi:hypothetical protein EGW08_011832 [Elysia chlorotica]|uniref:SAP domain-containing protein n=1 Tax=Elysia chlorotica TaxID=188477 RepID=A0A3S0ZQG5_ELYCH|nr:hypothetical protein EGW08_011832 [Elysia chlorotica]